MESRAQDRGELGDARARAGGERDELITAGNQQVIAYDPATGKELWRMKGLASNAVPSPVAGDDVVVLSSGYPEKVAVAIRPGGSGDITGTTASSGRTTRGRPTFRRPSSTTGSST